MAKNATVSTLVQCKIIDDICLSVICVSEKDMTESYRFLKQRIVNGSPFAILYETVFYNRKEVDAFFNCNVANTLLEKVGASLLFEDKTMAGVHVMAESDLGRTVQVDHKVTTFVVTVRSLSNVGTDSIKNLIEKKFEVVDINIADYQTVVR